MTGQTLSAVALIAWAVCSLLCFTESSGNIILRIITSALMGALTCGGLFVVGFLATLLVCLTFGIPLP
jgi:hypothetical protein